MALRLEDINIYGCLALAGTLKGTGRSELSVGPGDDIPCFKQVWPLWDKACSTPVSTADNGHLIAESSNLVFGVDGVERQEQAFLAPLFICVRVSNMYSDTDRRICVCVCAHVHVCVRTCICVCRMVEAWGRTRRGELLAHCQNNTTTANTIPLVYFFNMKLVTV